MTVNGCTKFKTLPPVPEVSFLRLAPTWADAWLAACVYLNRVDGTPLPNIFPNEPVLSSVAPVPASEPAAGASSGVAVSSHPM